MPLPSTATAGLYVHVPFCAAKCAYCDFYSLTDASLVPAYLTSLEREAALASPAFPHAADTLYLGGGTPSLLSPSQLERIFTMIRRHFRLRDDADATVEINPGTASAQEPSALRDLGVTRINVGVQSFDDAALGFLGRIHSSAEARTVLDRCRAAGFSSLGLDLIYGLPGQTPDRWRRDLEAALSFAPEHLSCYLLSYEPGTRLDRRRAAGEFSPLDDGACGDLLEFTHEFLAGAGYPAYEVSNFSRIEQGRDHRSRHNRKYWTGAPYLGLGPAAHSFLPPASRWWNVRSVAGYIRELEAGRLPVAERETLTGEQRLIEAIYLGLRQSDGLSFADLIRHFGEAPVAGLPAVAERLRSRGVMAHGDPWRLTLKGWRFLDAVAGEFVAAIHGA